MNGLRLGTACDSISVGVFAFGVEEDDPRGIETNVFVEGGGFSVGVTRVVDVTFIKGTPSLSASAR